MLSLSDLRVACHRQKLLWTTHRASAFFGVHDLFPQNIVLCTDDSPENDDVPGTRFFSYEGRSRVRPCARPDIESMLHEAWRAAEPELAERGWHALVSLPRRTVEGWAERTGSVVHSLSPDLRQRLNDKRTLFELLRELDLPRLTGEWTTVDARSFAHWKALYHAPFVLQAPTGMGGSGTAFVRTEREWQDACRRHSSEPVWIAPDAGSLSLNINSIALPRGSVAGYPSVQLTGFDFLNHSRAMYCGNDFSATARLPNTLLGEVRLQTERIGDYIASLGYVGLFGLDFVVGDRDDVPRAVDLNPRWQGSTPLFAQAQRLVGRSHLCGASILIETGLLHAADVARHRDDFFTPVEGAQIRMRAGASASNSTAAPPQPGVYSRDGRWNRPGILLEQLRGDEILITGGPPRPGTRVAPGAQWFRICARGSVLQPSGFQPADWIRDITSVVAPGAAPDTRRK